MEDKNSIPINNNIIINTIKRHTKKKVSSIRYSKSIYDEFNLNKMGSIKLAKIHSSANRPLNKVGEFNRRTEFCKCCNLPTEQEGIMEKFKFCDNPDNFVKCGEGITLYFIYFKFSIFIMIITFILVNLYNIIYSKKYYKELITICNRNYLPIEEDCKIYLEKTNSSKSYSLISSSYFFMFNSINIKYYRTIYYKLTSENNKKTDSIIINTSYMNFISSITLFIFNLLFIIIIYSKVQYLNISILSLSDYSIFLTNLNYIFKSFFKMKKEIDSKKDIAQNNDHIFNYEEELYNYLGIDKLSLNLSEFEQFLCFLKNKIFIEKKGQIFNIKKINICFKISNLMKLQEKLDKINEKISKIKNHPYQILKNEENKFDGDKRKYFSSFFDSIGMHFCEKVEELKELNEKEEKLRKQIKELMEKSKENVMDNFSGCAFVCLDNIKEHEQFLDSNSNKVFIIYLFKLFVYVFCRCCQSKNKKNIEWLKENIRFERAPEPEDIIFENLEYSKTFTKFLRIFLVYFFSLVLIVICFAIVTTLNYLRKYSDENNNYHIVVAYIVSLLISLCIFIINLFFEKIIDFLTKREKQSTTTNYFLSKSIKLTLFSFMNSGIVPLISEKMVSGKEEYLIINMLMIFLINSILVPLSWTINISYFYKKFRIWLIERKENPFDPDSNHGKTQRELNELYELPSMNIAEKYSYIFKTLLISFFYIPIFPLGVIISILGLFLGYFLEKFNFCHIYKRPEMLNDQLCKTYINFFITVLFISGVGDYYFNIDVYETKNWPLANMIVFGILIFVPYHYMIEYIIKDFLLLRESSVHKSSLDEVYLTFFNNYERANPMTKKEGITNYLNGLKSKEIISESIFQENMNNLQNVNLMKLYYDDSKQRDILKTQKSLLIKEEEKYKIDILYKSLPFRTKINNRDIGSILGSNNFELLKDLPSSVFIPHRNINKNEKHFLDSKRISINDSSERKIYINKNL